MLVTASNRQGLKVWRYAKEKDVSAIYGGMTQKWLGVAIGFDEAVKLMCRSKS